MKKIFAGAASAAAGLFGVAHAMTPEPVTRMLAACCDLAAACCAGGGCC